MRMQQSSMSAGPQSAQMMGGGGGGPMSGGMGEVGFDGKMLRKTIPRKTVDFNPSAVKYLEVSDHRLVDHLRPELDD